jgi:predicted HTH domain antitoxin
MSAGLGTSSTVTIELPNGFPAKIGETPEAFAREFRLAAAIEWYREGRISQERAAMFAGLGRWEFIEALGRVKVSVIHEEVLLDDIEQAVRAHKSLLRERAEASAGVFDRDAAEIHYRALGRWKGKLAAADVQTASRNFWLAAGEAGGYWLARRLRWESNVESLHAVAVLLAKLGPVALAPIVEELGENPASDQARALLTALGWLGESPEAPVVREASTELTLAQFLQNRDPDTRESAARALRLLPPARAAHWLGLRLGEEPNPDVAETIRDELARRPNGGG